MSMATTPAACPSCVFGATSTSVLSFSYHAVETITVSVIPHVTIYTNGTEKTSFESITETNTDYVGSGSNTTRPKTFTDKNDITWTVGDATLTYPTTYVQYLGFEGAPATTEDGETCAEPTDASAVELPSSTDMASFIYPLEANATGGMLLPTALLDYLAQLPEVSSQFFGEPLTGCAPLTWTPLASASASATGPSSSTTLAYTSSVSVPLGTGSLPLPQTTMPTSSGAPYPSSGVYSVPEQSSSRSGNYTYITTRIRPTNTLPDQEPSSQAPAPYESDTRTTVAPSPAPPKPPPVNPHNPLPGSYGVPVSSVIASHPSPPAYSTESKTTAPIAQHTTAFVISAVTGPTTYTTISGPQGQHTKDHGKGPDGYTTTKGGHEPGSTPNPSGGKPHDKPHDEPHDEPQDEPHDEPHDGPHDQPQDEPHDKPHNGPHHTGEDGTPTQHPQGPQHTGGNDAPTQVHHTDSPQHTGGSEHVSPADHGDKPHHTPQVYTHGHTSVTAGRGGAVVIGSKTVRPGHKVTIGSGPSTTIVALERHSGHTRLVMGGSTYHPVPQHVAVTPTPGGQQKPHVSAGVVTTNGHTITAIRSGKSMIIAEGSSTTTVRPGGKATFEGQTFSVPHRGGSIGVNGDGVQLTTGDGSQATISAGGHKFTAVDAGKWVIFKDGSSRIIVKHGSQTKFHGQTVSVAPSGTAVVINGRTTTLSVGGKTTATESLVVTAGGHTITALDRSGSVVLKESSSTATVKDGRDATFAGQTISVMPKGSVLVVNGKTTSFGASKTSTDVGSYITGGLGHGAGSSPGPSATPATGAASSLGSSSLMGTLGAGLLAFIGMVAIL
ncbi:uncharacterized protein LTR77_000348 [Saxophila tyrrhenica]|uniref:Uncharacterized protein n=1 Tax=Saxophila tyrrhenica TaxID=1690608 RepID=A0AAV9PMK2_9PEZI|nr:hypothetical protein LTR77_000348 [Saxophila tyrrhenica]